jgi:hypothetical protein
MLTTLESGQERIIIMDKYHQSFRFEVFQFLNGLRESGKTNMFGARPYLVDEFDLSKNQSAELLSMFMNNTLIEEKSDEM